MAETKTQPDVSDLDVEAKALVCVHGPRAGKLHQWNGDKAARFIIEEGGLTHVYAYTRLRMVGEGITEAVYVEFYGYAGLEGL